MDKQQKKISNRIINALTFSALFLFVGIVLPPFVSRFIPSSYYYYIENPVDINKQEYHPGDYITIIIERSSRIEQSAEETLELTLVTVDFDQDVISERRFVNVERGQRIIRTTMKIPEDSEPGSYVVRGNVKFEIEGMIRNVPLYSREFLVRF